MSDHARGPRRRDALALAAGLTPAGAAQAGTTRGPFDTSATAWLATARACADDRDSRVGRLARAAGRGAVARLAGSLDARRPVERLPMTRTRRGSGRRPRPWTRGTVPPRRTCGA